MAADRDRVKVTGNEATNDFLTAYTNSEDPDSWTLLEKNEDKLDKEPSGVEIIQFESDEKEFLKENLSKQKSRRDSQLSIGSQHDESSDGISIISESDRTSCEKVLLTEDKAAKDVQVAVQSRQNMISSFPAYDPVSHPFTLDEGKVQKVKGEFKKKTLELQRTEDKSVENTHPVVEHFQQQPVHYSSWIIFSLFASAMLAVILGNAMRLQHRADETNFDHEKRISELELENNILMNKINKLRHPYTRSELDEQVQLAEFEWVRTQREDAEVPAGSYNVDEAFGSAHHAPETSEQQPLRIVPSQDSGVERKVVWSGDEEEPMLVIDKKHFLPAFCYNQDQAVQNDLFFEYRAKYCEIRKRKIDVKQKQKEFQAEREPKTENYNKFINPMSMGLARDGASFEASKTASPFKIDYKKALDAIKSEGNLIMEALGSILDLSPKPERILNVEPERILEQEIKYMPEHLNERCNEEGTNTKFSKYDLDSPEDDRNSGTHMQYANKHCERDIYENHDDSFNYDPERQNYGRPWTHVTHKDDKAAENNKKKHERHHPTRYDMDGVAYQHKQKFETLATTKFKINDKKMDEHRGHVAGERQNRPNYGDDRGEKIHHYESSDKRERVQEKYHENGKHAEQQIKSYKGREEYRQKYQQQLGERHKGSKAHHQNDKQKRNQDYKKDHNGKEGCVHCSTQKQGKCHGKHYDEREGFRKHNAQNEGERDDKFYKESEVHSTSSRPKQKKSDWHDKHYNK